MAEHIRRSGVNATRVRDWWVRFWAAPPIPGHEDGSSHTWEHVKFDLWRCPKCGLMDGYDPLLDGPR